VCVFLCGDRHFPDEAIAGLSLHSSLIRAQGENVPLSD